MAGAEPTLVIGVDCATDARRVGLARAELSRGRARLTDACLGARDAAPAEVVAGWLGDARSALLALDAPLGWPALLGERLAGHEAGALLVGEADRLFHRATDEHVRRTTGRRPLEVGADRIARTGHAALAFLDALRARLDRPIPLAWEQGRAPEGIAAIEVYPAATLSAHGLPWRGYKRTAEGALRERLVAGLGARLGLGGLEGRLAGEADVLDAALCVLAGLDFLAGETPPPPDPTLARREGWIWVRGDRAG